MGGRAYKAVVVAMAGVVGTDGSSCGSCVGIRRDEQAELGPPIVWVKFVVNLFPDEFYQ